MAVDLLDLGEFTGDEDQGTGFDPIDSGRYTATVFEVTREVGKSSGKPYLKWCFSIAEGQPFAGRRLWDNTSLSDNAKWRLVSLLKALGVDVPKGRLKINPNDLLGREIILNVGLEDDEYHDPTGELGIQRNIITGFQPAKGCASKPKIQVPEAKPATAKAAPKKSAKKRAKATQSETDAPWDEPKQDAKPEPLPITPAADDDDDDFDFE